MADEQQKQPDGRGVETPGSVARGLSQAAEEEVSGEERDQDAEPGSEPAGAAGESTPPEQDDPDAGPASAPQRD